jgi:hypothetical protein
VQSSNCFHKPTGACAKSHKFSEQVPWWSPAPEFLESLRIHRVAVFASFIGAKPWERFDFGIRRPGGRFEQTATWNFGFGR